MKLSLRRVEALVFDLDGVLTDTASQHFRAWKRMFDEYLRERAPDDGDVDPFTREDYLRDVDGKPRIDGARSFLESRGIDLETGSPDDPEDAGTVWALGNRKNRMYHEILEEEGVEPFPDAVDLLRRAREADLDLAVVSSSRNLERVVRAAELESFFDASVGGVDLADLDLEGKPAPDLFLEAVRRLGVEPARAVVFEDARSGVEAGRRGGFAEVVGVARSGGRRGLLDAGADEVVSRLDDIDLSRTEDTENA